jgi:carbamoyl-phosphate synthase small subunit
MIDLKEIVLVLENGDEFHGHSFGYEQPLKDGVLGEVVFNTSMTGYQEVFSDPSYCDQIVVMTYPLIGNYGATQHDYENLTPHLRGVVVREYCEMPSNWRNEKTMQDFLIQHKVPGLCNIDTRRLTKTLRSQGAMKGVIVSKASQENAKMKLKEELTTDQISRVSCTNATHFPGTGPRVVMMDFGYKKNILNSLVNRGCDVIVVPYNYTFEQIERYHPKGILLSNGPGDPKDVPEVIPTIQELQSKYPLFAICMGHQLFALANGANTTKMKFGHRGANHPVYDKYTDRVYITSQNHGYCVDDQSVNGTELEVSQVNLNDKTVEGLKHKTLNASSVQYHPEANPGPNDTKFLFDDFLKTISGETHA